MGKSATKSFSFLLLLAVTVSLGNLLTDTEVHAAEPAAWPQLFAPSCTGGGCLSFPTQCPSDIQYFSSSTVQPGSISIGAQNTTGQTCLAIDASQSCLFLVGDSGITQITFDFTVAEACYSPPSQIAWLSFWIRSIDYSSTAEVDFIESKHGPVGANGLYTNFAAKGTQVVIYCAAEPPSNSPIGGSCPAGCTCDKGCNFNPGGPDGQGTFTCLDDGGCTCGSGDWTGTITADFSGLPGNVSAKVNNSINSNVGSSYLTGGPKTLSAENGYYFVMDIDPECPYPQPVPALPNCPQPIFISPQCTMTISNLKVQGTVPPMLGGNLNCAGLPGVTYTSQDLEPELQGY